MRSRVVKYLKYFDAVNLKMKRLINFVLMAEYELAHMILNVHLTTECLGKLEGRAG